MGRRSRRRPAPSTFCGSTPGAENRRSGWAARVLPPAARARRRRVACRSMPVCQQPDRRLGTGARFEWTELAALGCGLVAQTHLVEYELDARRQSHDIVVRQAKRPGRRVLRTTEVKDLR